MLELYPDRDKNLSMMGYNSSSESESEHGSRNESSGGTPEVKVYGK